MRFLLECALFLLLLEIKGHHSEWAPHIASKLLEISPSQHVAGKVLDLGHKTTLHVNNEVGPILCEDDNGCGHKKVTTPSILVPQIFFAKSPKSQKVLKTAQQQTAITKTAKDITASVDDISDSDSTEKKPSKALKQKKTPETTKTEKITRNRKDVTESDDDVSNDDSSDKKPHKGQKRMIVQKNTKHRKRPRNHKDMTESDDDDDTTEKKPSKAPKRNNKTRKRPKITNDILLSSKSDGDVNNYDDTTDEKPPKAPKRKKTPKNKKTRKRPRTPKDISESDDDVSDYEIKYKKKRKNDPKARKITKTPKDISESDYDVSEDDSTDPKKQKKGPQNIKARKITKNPKDISESDYDVSNDDIANSMTTEEKDSSSDESLEDKWSKKKHHKKHKSHKVNRIAYIGSIKNVVKSGVMAYEWNSGEVKQKRKYRAKKYKTALKHEIEGNSKQICILNVNGEYCVRHNTDTRSKTYEGMEIL